MSGAEKDLSKTKEEMVAQGGELEATEATEAVKEDKLEPKELATRRCQRRQLTQEEIGKICRSIEEGLKICRCQLNALRAKMEKDDKVMEKLRQEQRVMRNQINELLE